MLIVNDIYIDTMIGLDLLKLACIYSLFSSHSCVVIYIYICVYVCVYIYYNALYSISYY